MIEYKINNQIECEKILLINENGENTGLTTLSDGLVLARNIGLDLVCLNPNNNPPVCKIMNYSKYKYECSKKEKSNKKQKEPETKEIQLRPQIADHDINVRLKKCREELLHGNKIRLVISLKGRQADHPEIGFELLNKIKNELIDVSTIYKDGKLDGRRIECILNPKK